MPIFGYMVYVYYIMEIEHLNKAALNPHREKLEAGNQHFERSTLLNCSVDPALTNLVHFKSNARKRKVPKRWFRSIPSIAIIRTQSALLYKCILYCLFNVTRFVCALCTVHRHGHKNHALLVLFNNL